MKKKIITVIIASILLITSAAVAHAAADIPEDYELLMLDGFDRVLATSSYSPDCKDAAGTSPLFDHRTGTACSFDLSDRDEKVVTVYVASRTKEIVERFACLTDGDASVRFYATNDADLKEWKEFDIKAVENSGEWAVFEVEDIDEGYAFYRIEFEVSEGDTLAVKELALFRTSEKSPSGSEPKNVFEKEPWRKLSFIRRLGR